MTHVTTFMYIIKNTDLIITNSNSMDSFLINYRTLTVQ